MSEAMKNALKNRKMKGLDVTIILGGAHGMNDSKLGEKEEHEGSDLAPDAEHVPGGKGSSDQLEMKDHEMEEDHLEPGEDASFEHQPGDVTDHADEEEDKKMFAKMLEHPGAPGSLSHKVHAAMGKHGAPAPIHAGKPLYQPIKGRKLG